MLPGRRLTSKYSVNKVERRLERGGLANDGGGHTISDLAYQVDQLPTWPDLSPRRFSKETNASTILYRTPKLVLQI